VTAAKAHRSHAPSLRLDRGALVRALIGFAAGLVFWFAFSAPYERFLAAASGSLIDVFESPTVTHLTAANGEILVDRADFPPSSPRPGLSAADLHFNFVLLAALFALARHPLASRAFGRFWIAAALLAVVHVVALVFQVEGLYATSLGDWSSAHYGAFARNLWAGGFHFYLIAGRFAAPFALWWALGRNEEKVAGLESRVKGRGRASKP
jgi:hypothetical protein